MPHSAALTMIEPAHEQRPRAEAVVEAADERREQTHEQAARQQQQAGRAACSRPSTFCM